MHKKRSAFTLIELLVVIAIIAILAAILFPVFAQAKLAAKASASLSNTKQQSLAVLMYGNDYDDMWVTDMTFNVTGAAYGFPAPWGGFNTWSASVIPYIKTSQIFIDPIAGGTNGANTNVQNWEAWNPEYGLNWPLLDGGLFNVGTNSNAPSYGTTSETALSRPADMVMISSTSLATDPGYEDIFYLCQNNVICSVLGAVEGPWCYATGPNVGCSDLSNGWGTDNGWAGENPDTYPSIGYTEGGDTSGNAMRDNGLVVSAFCDGHSKTMPIGSLAVGTNWTPQILRGNIQLTNKDTYRWWQY